MIKNKLTNFNGKDNYIKKMTKLKNISSILILGLMLTSCSLINSKGEEVKSVEDSKNASQSQVSNLSQNQVKGQGMDKKESFKFYMIDVFDTKIDLIGYDINQVEFDKKTQVFKDEFTRLHKLYDTFHNYEGINNAKTINDKAGIEPVKVDKDLFNLIKEGKDLYNKGSNRTNIAMGPVLIKWHELREKYLDSNNDPSIKTQIPNIEELKKLLPLCDINKIVLDEANSTVFLKEKGMLLDVGALAKGYATELVANKMREVGLKEGIISAGGNIKVIGAPNLPDKKYWSVGIQNPFQAENKEQILDLLYLKSGSVVSSGDYERYYLYNGQRMHHIVDPDTLMPGTNFSQVTIITEDSGKADFYSTALYLLSYEEGLDIAKKEGLDVIWVFKDKSIKTTPNIEKLMKSKGAKPGV